MRTGKRLGSFLVFSLLFLWTSAEGSPQYARGPTPSWVKIQALPLEIPPPKPSQIGLQHLLIDTQRNRDERTLYSHFIIKALTQDGTESFSQIKVDFDPSCTQVVMHEIRIFREGQWHNRLEKARHHLVQREARLEQNLYDGDFSLVYFIDDFREGDILEYAYSLVGENPLTSSHYADKMYLQRTYPVEKIVYRLVADIGLNFSVKEIGTKIEPQIRDLSSSLREWVWEVTETDPYIEEWEQPIWYHPPAQIQMSEYSSWKEVVQSILPLYIVPREMICPEMHDCIKKWQKSSSDLAQQALLALRFVQDEIRYFGFEDGIRAFRPEDPVTTFERRFGDCKDKSFLLHVLLREMGISSKIILVHSYRGSLLPETLPTPFAFNHAVLQMEIGDRIYFVDPTYRLQGGSLEMNCFPDYGWGLVLAEETPALTCLPKYSIKDPTEIDSQCTVLKEDLAQLTTKSVFYGMNADGVRRSLEWNGLKRFSKNCLSEMQEFYGTASLSKEMEVVDDRENNALTLIESYHIPTCVIEGQTQIDLLSHTLKAYLHKSMNPERLSPYVISYPLWVKERIQIETPFIDWTPYKDRFNKDLEPFFYHFSVDIAKNRADFNFELKHLQDHISKQALHDSWEAISQISRRGFPSMVVVNPQETLLTPNFFPSTALTALLVWVPMYLISRKKRPEQDGLSFHLRKSQVFYTTLNAFSFVALGIGSYLYQILPILLIPIVAMRYIIINRSMKLIIGLEACLLIQICVISFLLFTTLPHLYLEHKCMAISVYGLYVATVLIALRRANQYLLEEKNMKESILNC